MTDQLIIFFASYLYLLSLGAVLVFFLRQSRDAQKRIIGYAAMLLPLAYLVARLGRALYYNPRPFVQEGFAPLVSHVADNGFPSDHTLLAGSLAALVLPLNKKLSAVLWLLAVFVGAARVLAGVHHAVDVLASIAIAAGAGWFGYRIVKTFFLR